MSHTLVVNIEANSVSTVADLVDANMRSWKEDLIRSTFTSDIANRILMILLAKEPHEDFAIWKGEPFGDFSVRSAYKLL